MKVKICGIRSLEHAQIAIDASADFLGFNFISSSKRYIKPIKAKEIINQLQIKNYAPQEYLLPGSGELRINVVGVFQNQSVEEVNKIAEDLSLDFVQLHGEEDERYMEKIKAKIIKKINQLKITHPKGTGFPEAANYELKNDNVVYYLLDRELQGTGEMVDLGEAKEIAEKLPVFFAGGLTVENVSDVVSSVKPFAVDVASGVETNGVMDREKIEKFIANAKGRIV